MKDLAIDAAYSSFYWKRSGENHYNMICYVYLIFDRIEEVTWHEKDILVMNSVRIQPPYRPENCVPSNEAHSAEHQSVAHIRNIVEKHLKVVAISYYFLWY